MIEGIDLSLAIVIKLLARPSCLSSAGIHASRPHRGQQLSAWRLRSLLHSKLFLSEIAGSKCTCACVYMHTYIHTYICTYDLVQIHAYECLVTVCVKSIRTAEHGILLVVWAVPCVHMRCMLSFAWLSDTGVVYTVCA